MFSEGITNRGDCIGAAKSNNGLNFVPINTWTFCSPTQSTGFLDPSLFVDPAGRVWLLFSQQWAPNGGSAIDAVQIDALGIFDGSENRPFPAGDCGIVGESAGRSCTAYTLLSYGSVANINANPGSSSFLEGPSMTTDDYNGFDLTFSLGTWSSNSTYDTGELPCGSPSGGCLPSCDGRVISGGGGASTASDGSPNGNVMMLYEHVERRPKSGLGRLKPPKPISMAVVAQVQVHKHFQLRLRKSILLQAHIIGLSVS